MKQRRVVLLGVLLVFLLACSQLDSVMGSTEEASAPAPTQVQPSPTPLIAEPVTVGDAGTDEPVLVTGTIPFTSPFFMDGIAEPFVLLDRPKRFSGAGCNPKLCPQRPGDWPVELVEDGLLQYSLSLPAVPQAVLHDV